MHENWHVNCLTIARSRTTVHIHSVSPTSTSESRVNAIQAPTFAIFESVFGIRYICAAPHSAVHTKHRVLWIKDEKTEMYVYIRYLNAHHLDSVANILNVHEMCTDRRTYSAAEYEIITIGCRTIADSGIGVCIADDIIRMAASVCVWEEGQFNLATDAPHGPSPFVVSALFGHFSINSLNICN